MYLKQRDKNILYWMEDVSAIKDRDGINSKIAGYLFYSDCKQPTYNASRRLKDLFREGFLKRHRVNPYDEYVYYREARPLSGHQMKLLEVYGAFSTIGEITLFEREVGIKCQKRNRKNDGLIVVKVDDYEFPIIIEIDKSHDTDTGKMNDIYNSGYYQQRFGLMPLFIIVKRYEFQKKHFPQDVNVVYVDWDLSQINRELFDID